MQVKVLLIFAVVAIGCCLVHAQDGDNSGGGGDQQGGDQGGQQQGGQDQSGNQGPPGGDQQQGGGPQGGQDQGGNQGGQGQSGGPQQGGQGQGGSQGAGGNPQGGYPGGGSPPPPPPNQGGYPGGGGGASSSGSSSGTSYNNYPAPGSACWWCYSVYRGWATPSRTAVSAVTTGGAGWYGPGASSSAVAVAGGGGAAAASSAGGLGSYFGSFFYDVSPGSEVKTKKAACNAVIEQYSDKGPVEAKKLVSFINSTFYATPKAQQKSAKGVTPSTLHCCHVEFAKEYFPKSMAKYPVPILPKGVTCQNLITELFNQLSGANDKKQKSGKAESKGNVAKKETRSAGR